jgi:ubiquinol-cytochrome c reductase cytochrome c subunit
MNRPMPTTEPAVRPHSTMATWLMASGLVVLAVAFATVFSPGGLASAQGDDTAEGAALYADNCASCHGADAAGIPGSFPPLRGNPNVADAAYVESVIIDGLTGPLEVDGVAYDAVMPAIAVADGEATAIAAYVASIAEGGSTTDTTEPAPPEPGDPSEGQSLFEGAARFDNGGAACVGCHTAGEVGNFGGPGLGPDLTDVSEQLGGEAGLAGWLKSPPTPTMIPIFDDHPLTDPEVADLAAFLEVAPDQDKASPPVDWLVVGGLVGLVVLIAGMAIAWRGMRQSYVERLRSRQ